jgi:hypothetical protein
MFNLPSRPEQGIRNLIFFFFVSFPPSFQRGRTQASGRNYSTNATECAHGCIPRCPSPGKPPLLLTLVRWAEVEVEVVVVVVQMDCAPNAVDISFAGEGHAVTVKGKLFWGVELIADLTVLFLKSMLVGPLHAT